MKRAGALILLCFILVCSISGCTNTEKDITVLDYVNLCDYTSLEISKDEYTVSDADISTAIQMYLGSLDIEASDISDNIAVKYFGCENAARAKEKIKREIIENRFYEAARDTILTSSEIIAYPQSSREYVNEMVSTQEAFAEAEGVSFSDYLHDTYNMTEKEFREAALLGYADIMILRAIAEKENYKITPDERNEVIENTAALIGATAEDTLEMYGEEYFDCLLYEEFLKNLLLNYYSSEINAMLKT